MPKSEQDINFKSLFLPFTTKKAVIYILIIGIIVYFNSLFNGFVGDDGGQFIANNITHSITNLPLIFRSVLQSTGNINYSYRPIGFVIATFLISLFGTSPFYFHLLQIVIHITSCIFFYLLLKKHVAILIAFFATLVFLIHPVNSETVSYISDLQDVLFVFFGLIAISISTLKLAPLKKVLLLSAALLLSILSKETGGLFLIIVPLYSFLVLQKQKKYIFISTVFSSFVYLFLRFAPNKVVSIYNIPSAISTLDITHRLLNVPKIIFHYLLTFVFPDNLAIGWNWIVEKTTFTNFYLPLFFDLLFLIFLIVFFCYLYLKKNKLTKLYLFFLIWFLLGLIMHIQIMPLDFTVADRWMYFPLIGLLGLIGIVVSTIHNMGMNKRIAIFAFFALLVAFGIRTAIRNANFYNDITLSSHDLKVIPGSSVLENTLGGAYLANGDLFKAKTHLERSIVLDEHSQAWNNLGIMYAKSGDLKTARKYLQNSVKFSSSGEYKLAYINLAKVDFFLNNFGEGKQIAEAGLVKFPDEPALWLTLAAIENKLNNQKAVLQDIQKAKNIDKNININDIIKDFQQY